MNLMENKSAEDVLEQVKSENGLLIIHNTPLDKQLTIQAMKEYAQLEALAFHYWMDKSSEYREVSKNQYRNVAGKIFTTEELYQQFLTDKNK